MTLSLLLILSVFHNCSADPKQYPVYSIGGNYRSPPIGLSPSGGVITAFMNITGPNATTHANQLYILSEPQLELWNKPIVARPGEDPPPFDSEMKLGSYFTEFNTTAFVTYTADSAEKYFVLMIFPDAKVADEKFYGAIQIDWRQSSGEYLQYQYMPLMDSMDGAIGILGIFTVWYVFQCILPRRKSLTKIHFFYLLTLVYTVAFLAVWQYSARWENVSGDRDSIWSKWLPSLMQKGFDILECLVYLLTSLGWQLMRPSLSVEELKIIIVGCTLSMILGVFEINCGDDQYLCGGYTSGRMVIHMFGYLTAIMAYTAYLTMLKHTVTETSIASYDACRLYQRLHSYEWLRVIFFAFVCQPTVAVIIRTELLGWEDEWLFMTFFWLSKIFLVAAIIVAFQPRTDVMQIVKSAIRHRRDQETNNSR